MPVKVAVREGDAPETDNAQEFLEQLRALSHQQKADFFQIQPQFSGQAQQQPELQKTINDLVGANSLFQKSLSGHTQFGTTISPEAKNGPLGHLLSRITRTNRKRAA